MTHAPIRASADLTARATALCRALGCALALQFAADAHALDVDATARVVAGMTASVPTGVRLVDPTLREYAHNTSAYWHYYERHIGEPMQKWAREALAESLGGTVFYPFSGPDFATVYRLYPQAGRYVLVALQRAGAPPALDRAPAAELAGFLARFEDYWKHFAQIGFFRTLDLDEEAKHPGIHAGMTALLMAFAVRCGFSVVAVEPVRVNAAGTDLETHPGNRAEARTWDSVRISLKRAARNVELDYVRVNLSNASLNANPAVRAWIERMAGYPILLKAASHLPQDSRFSVVRDALLKNAPSIVQDETGIEFTRLKQTFSVTLYGHFSKPHKLFNQEAQRALAEAYKTTPDVKPLPFRVSYQRLPEANLQVAVRRH